MKSGYGSQRTRAVRSSACEIVGDGPATLTLRTQKDRVVRSDFGRQVLDANRPTLTVTTESLDHVLRLAHVPWPGVPVSAFIASGVIVEIDERPAAVNCVRNWLASTGISSRRSAAAARRCE
jgi:hypothetical protein